MPSMAARVCGVKCAQPGKCTGDARITLEERRSFDSDRWKLGVLSERVAVLHIINVKWRKLHATGNISHVVWHFRANNKCNVQYGMPLGTASCAFFLKHMLLSWTNYYNTVKVCSLHMPSFTGGVWHKNQISGLVQVWLLKPKTERSAIIKIGLKKDLPS